MPISKDQLILEGNYVSSLESKPRTEYKLIKINSLSRTKTNACVSLSWTDSRGRTQIIHNYTLTFAQWELVSSDNKTAILNKIKYLYEKQNFYQKKNPFNQNNSW